jgi:hypothetical protein
MRAEIPRIRQLTFQLGQAPPVLTRRTLPAEASAPSHPLVHGPRENCVACAGGVIAEADDQSFITVFLSSQEKERRFLSGLMARVTTPKK